MPRFCRLSRNFPKFGFVSENCTPQPNTLRLPSVSNRIAVRTAHDRIAPSWWID